MTNWEKWIKDNWEHRAAMVCNQYLCESCPFAEACASGDFLDGVTKFLDKEYEPTKEELSLKVSLLEDRIRELEQALTRAEEKAARAEIHSTQGRC